MDKGAAKAERGTPAPRGVTCRARRTLCRAAHYWLLSSVGVNVALTRRPRTPGRNSDSPLSAIIIDKHSLWTCSSTTGSRRWRCYSSGSWSRGQSRGQRQVLAGHSSQVRQCHASSTLARSPCAIFSSSFCSTLYWMKVLRYIHSTLKISDFRQVLKIQDAVGDGRLRPRCRHLSNWTKHTRHYVKTWRHPQNRKYITYCIAQRRTEPRHQETSTKMWWDFDVQFLSYESRQTKTDSVTNRHADRNTWQAYWGEVTKLDITKGNTSREIVYHKTNINTEAIFSRLMYDVQPAERDRAIL